MVYVVENLLSAPRVIKKLITYLVDVCLHAFSYSAAVFLTLQSIEVGTIDNYSYIHSAISISASILLLALLGFYKAVNRFVSLKILITVFIATLLSSIIYYSLGLYLDIGYAVASSSVLYGTVLCILLGGSRLLVRSYFSMRYNTQKKRVVIYGAGSAGRQLATSLISGDEYYPVAFVDDDKTLNGVVIQGIKVFLSSDLKDVVNSYNIEKSC